MLLTYQECLDKYGSDYQLKKEIGNGNLFMKEKEIYSTLRNASEIEVIMLKYPKTVCTGKSAFYYHSLSDVIPDHYYLATRRTDTRIKDPRIRQSFLKDDIFDAGITKIQYNNSSNARRATQDLDLDFIRYSISDDSIRRFVEKLNCIDGLTIKLYGNITELNHQDYKGKRISISVTDTEATAISLKMDIGVHNDLSIEQDEYA